MRRVGLLVVVVALAMTLVGCTAPPKPTVVAGCPTAKPGAVSNAVGVTGKVGAKPAVTLAAPIATVKKTQRTLVTAGTGAVAKAGQIVRVDYAMFNGTSGKELTSTGFEGRTVPFTLDPNKFLPGIVDTLQCSRIGDRVVGVIPPADAFHAAGSTTLGIGPTDEIVVVADIVAVDPAPSPALGAPQGTTQSPTPGFPVVKVDAKGIPSVIVPSTPQPKALDIEVLVTGDGAKVGSNANVIVNMQAVLWRTGKVIEGNDTWATGKTAVYNTGQFLRGFKQAVEGQTVGSRIVAVVPPSLLYGDKGNATAGIRGTDDVVFLIDILGIG